MRRIVVALLVGIMVASVAYGLAASLDVLSDDLGAGSDDVASCDVDGVTVSYNIGFDSTANAYLVDSVLIEGIDATNCVDENMSVTLTDEADAVLASSGPTVIAGATATIPVTGVTAAEVYGVHVAITGDDPTTP